MLKFFGVGAGRGSHFCPGRGGAGRASLISSLKILISGQYVHQDKMSVEKSAKSGQYVHKDNLSQDEMSQDEMSQDKTSQDKMSVRTKRLLAAGLLLDFILKFSY